MTMLFHVVKAIVLAVMMFLSLQFLGFPVAGSAIFSLIPLLLGLLNVFTGFAYGLTGLIFIVASTTALIPNWRTQALELWEAAKSQAAAVQSQKDSEKASGAEKSNNGEE